MAFVLKKSKRVEVPLGEGDDALILLIKKIKVEKILSLYQDHVQFLEDTETTRDSDTKTVRLPIDLMRDLKATMMEAAVGWKNVVDEEGNTVPFSKELLEELISHDMSLYMEIMKGVSLLYGSPELEKSEKNSLAASTSASVH